MMPVMYQVGIDAAKHGGVSLRAPAALILVPEIDLCYTVAPMSSGGLFGRDYGHGNAAARGSYAKIFYRD
jgi:hypothetical protein